MAKQHDKQFKLDAVQYYQDHKDLGVRGCAENLGIGYSTLTKSIAFRIWIVHLKNFICGYILFTYPFCKEILQYILMLYLPGGGAMLFLIDVDHGSFEKAKETRQINLQAATVSLQVVISLCKRKETAALKLSFKTAD